MACLREPVLVPYTSGMVGAVDATVRTIEKPTSSRDTRGRVGAT